MCRFRIESICVAIYEKKYTFELYFHRFFLSIIIFNKETVAYFYKENLFAFIHEEITLNLNKIVHLIWFPFLVCFLFVYTNSNMFVICNLL